MMPNVTEWLRPKGLPRARQSRRMSTSLLLPYAAPGQVGALNGEDGDIGFGDR